MADAEYRATDFHHDYPLNEPEQYALDCAEADAKERLQIVAHHMARGVRVIDPHTTYIGGDVKIGEGTVIFPCTYIHREVVIGSNCQIGPFAYIRQGTQIGNGSKVGDFVEIKNSRIGVDTKIPHLAYVGDAEVGSYSNLGGGTVVVNYDGQNKHRTVIGDDAFVGCNSSLVAPVHVHDGAFIAAGSTITEEVPAHSLAIARARQTVKKNWKRPAAGA